MVDDYKIILCPSGCPSSLVDEVPLDKLATLASFKLGFV